MRGGLIDIEWVILQQHVVEREADGVLVGEIEGLTHGLRAGVMDPGVLERGLLVIVVGKSLEDLLRRALAPGQRRGGGGGAGRMGEGGKRSSPEGAIRKTLCHYLH